MKSIGNILFICTLVVECKGVVVPTTTVPESTIAEIKYNADLSINSISYIDKSSTDVRTNANYTYGFDLEGQPCLKDDECNLINYQIAEDMRSPLVKRPICLRNNSSPGYCTCGDYCVSYSYSSSGNEITQERFYYCGPCGRLGSECNGNVDCTDPLGRCINGVCQCQDGGRFINLYYCVIPFNGYEKALQIALATCIFVSACLLLATIYTSTRSRGQMHPYLLRLLARSQQQGTRVSPPGDTPPKYDDVIADDQGLPSYQEATGGVVNEAYDSQHDDTSTSVMENQSRASTDVEQLSEDSGYSVDSTTSGGNEESGEESQVDRDGPLRRKGAVKRNKHTKHLDRNEGINQTEDEITHI